MGDTDVRLLAERVDLGANDIDLYRLIVIQQSRVYSAL